MRTSALAKRLKKQESRQLDCLTSKVQMAQLWDLQEQVADADMMIAVLCAAKEDHWQITVALEDTLGDMKD